MRTLLAFMICLTAAAAPCRSADVAGRDPLTFPASTDWPWWRGPLRNGIADADQKIPLKFGEAENVVWKAAIPGRGHGSPTVVGDQVVLATADETKQVQSVLCFDRQTGRLAWKTDVHAGGLMNKKGNKKASQASSTVACDGQRLFINFLNRGALYTTALGRDGKQLWQQKITDYVVHQGYGSSPAIYQSLVIVSGDNKGGGAIAALDQATGKIVWKLPRPKMPNYASPVIFRLDNRDQLLFTGCNLVSSFDPLTGEKLWEVPGSTTECVTSIVSDGRLVFTSGGYPKNHVSALAADGTGKVVWENGTRVYVPSMVVKDKHLYAVTDAGVAVCWESATGKLCWQGRLGGTFSSSPVLVGDQILVINESGGAFTFQADPDAFQLLATNQLGDQVMATPTICGGRIYARVVHDRKERRQEMLYSIGR